MHIEKLKTIQETLASEAELQIHNLECVDAKELGEVIDIIKDIEETIYYCTITKAMENGSNYEDMRYYTPIYRYDDRRKDDYYPPYEDRMYYSGRDGNSSSNMSNSGNNNSSTNHNSDSSHYTEREYPHAFEDKREGKSYRSRRMYMEAKETKQDKTIQMRELEKYMQELAQDVIEMVEDASPEERQYLSKKVSALATKLSQTNG